MPVLHDVLNNSDYMLDLCVRMAHHSTAIEGNTLTLAQSKSVIVDNYIPIAVKEREFYEVRNYRYLTPLLMEALQANEIINNELIKKFHSVVMRDLHKEAGMFKMVENMIIGADFEPTKPYLVASELKNWCDNLQYKLESTNSLEDKLAAIFESHIQFEKIHPFSDGNGRVGRLLIVYSCLEQSIAPLVIPQDKREFYIACLSENRVDDLVEFGTQLVLVEKERMRAFGIRES
ncbi:Fic family protein [Helicobacter canis]|uniref:Fic family protein n=1 Tax=Helicobacter canis TaxID=29419 RepID=A0A5M9QLN0_9HELI|nr:Fic family protein [Helicobacter canis]KAA8707865.1 Fic family protein [Helicobacter canis]